MRKILLKILAAVTGRIMIDPIKDENVKWWGFNIETRDRICTEVSDAHYYAFQAKGEMFELLAGPFAKEAEAERAIRKVQGFTFFEDPRSQIAPFGVMALDRRYQKSGRLNLLLGIG